MKLFKFYSCCFRFWPLVAIFLLSLVFFWKFFFQGLLPVPADTIVGMYHPWREVVWDGLTAGVPFKNFLITDSVRQQLPWRKLVIDALHQGQWPAWNPYAMTGLPLAANLQSAPLYIFNFLFFIFEFPTAWSILIWLQPLLAAVFMYLFLQEKKLSQPASLLGAISFAFSGFFIAWLEWGTVLHAALWLPLILLSIEKILSHLIKPKFLIWALIFIFSLVQSFFAGHLQVFFYVFLFSFGYLFYRVTPLGSAAHTARGVTQHAAPLQKLFLFMLLYSCFIILTLPQWRGTWQLIGQSARQIDQADWTKPGWFVPWRHLGQFFAPDFFGNPTTLNYWGEWNYAEMVGFVGVIPLFLALWAIAKGKAKFFTLSGLVVLSFALPTPWAKLIYQGQIPFLSTSQPTRLLFLVDFCLVILAAYGLEEFFKKPSWKILRPVTFYATLWLVVLLGRDPSLAIAQRNLILPTGMALIFVALVIAKKIKFIIHNSKFLILSVLLALTVFDLFRFGWKFEPFVNKSWLFPTTKTIEFLQKDQDIFRIMATDSRLTPPNFAGWYGLQDIAGYDPLYLQRFGELAAAMERDEPNIQPPLGFNRIVTPKNWDSPLVNLLNVKYFLSLTNLNSPDLELVFREGETRVYQNKAVFPRAFLVYDYRVAASKQEAIELTMQTDLEKTVILEESPGGAGASLVPALAEPGEVEITDYQANEVRLVTDSQQPGILVLTDAFYPGWQASADGQTVVIYRADYHFRAVVVPEGKHEIVYRYSQL